MKTTQLELCIKTKRYNIRSSQHSLQRLKKSFKKETIQKLQEFKSNSLLTQARMSEELVGKLPAFEKGYNIMGDNTTESIPEKKF